VVFRQLLSLILLVVAALSLGACSLVGGGGDEDTGAGDQTGSALTLGSSIPLAGQASLVCSPACGERGQCGTNVNEGGKMVLLSTAAPRASDHDWTMPEGTPVTIERQELVTVFLQRNNASAQVPYYYVNVPGRGPAWVAGWCVGQ
jgi:hypothetical protein